MTIFANWPAPSHVNALTTTRQGGVSVPPYASLNLAYHVGDDVSAVAENRRQLIQQYQLPSAPCYLEQIHSNQVIELSGPSSQVPQADAAYTRQPNVVCAVMTADCLPILLCDVTGQEIAAIHAGWRGLVQQIIEQTLTKFQQPRHAIMAWLGPAIGPSKFEVGSEVRAQFIAYHASMTHAFIPSVADKYLADIYQLARIILQQQGIDRIYGGQYCTVTQTEQFFSYRREQQTGRMVSLIWQNRQ